MMEETYLVDNIKEQVCFVSRDLASDLAASRKGTHKLEYVLPDGVNERIGYPRKPLAKGEHTKKNAKEQVRPFFQPHRAHTAALRWWKISRDIARLSLVKGLCQTQRRCTNASRALGAPKAWPSGTHASASQQLAVLLHGTCVLSKHAFKCCPRLCRCWL